MPNAGLLELVAHGVQDIYLIGNPQITFFKVVYKRHTNFSMESIQTSIDGSTNFGNKAIIKIPRKADLMHTMTLEVDLPLLSTVVGNSSGNTGAKGTITWVDNIGHALIEFMEFKINGNIIDRQYGEWMEIWTQLSTSESKKRGLDKMLDRTGSLSTTGPKTVYIPLHFWFCRNIGLALPLCALQYHEVELEITLRDFSELTTLGSNPYYKIQSGATSGSTTLIVEKIDTSQTPSLDDSFPGRYIVFEDGTKYSLSDSSSGINEFTDAGPYTLTLTTALTKSYSTGSEVYFKKNGKLSSSSYSVTDMRLFIDYIYLDTYERKEFALAKHRYLIEQVQDSGIESLPEGTIVKKFNLNFNLPVKELFWTIQLARVDRNNDLFNYSNTVADGISQDNTMEKCVIMMNGIERFQERKSDYFRLIQPYYKHTRVPDKYFYIYAFAIQPEDHQPSGCSNFSKIDTVDVNITLNANMPATNLRFYALNYNILRIYNGMGGIAFSN
jgi:hypothetical protein